MKIKERAALIGRFLLARLQEPSTIKGLILAVSALGWWKMDSQSQGEGIAQLGLLVVGLINAGLPQAALYGPNPTVLAPQRVVEAPGGNDAG